MKKLIVFFALLFGMNCIASAQTNVFSVSLTPKRSNSFYKKDSVSFLQKLDTTPPKKITPPSIVVIEEEDSPSWVKQMKLKVEENILNAIRADRIQAYQNIPPKILTIGFSF